MSQDQRRDPRIATRQKLWCEGQPSSAAAETRDVSRTGMFIVAEHAPEVGAQLDVSFEGDDGEISLKLEVIWRGPKAADSQTGVGVRIVGFEKGREAYERFVNRHIKELQKPPARRSSVPAPASTAKVGASAG